VRLGATHSATIETLAATCHGLDVETLVGREVVAHRRTTFNPRMCGLCRGVAAVATVLIGYDVGLLPDEHEEVTIVIDYFLYTDV
jgi:hypothetical protein